ncbi:MAG TPA: hypothetical protein VFB68_05765 [Xanthobacteraceae bacterium]|jgi:hypothetical protein|nr:hypothetical protein [Xanthobacteraceae bacterium]
MRRLAILIVVGHLAAALSTAAAQTPAPKNDPKEKGVTGATTPSASSPISKLPRSDNKSAVGTRG